MRDCVCGANVRFRGGGLLGVEVRRGVEGKKPPPDANGCGDQCNRQGRERGPARPRPAFELPPTFGGARRLLGKILDGRLSRSLGLIRLIGSPMRLWVLARGGSRCPATILGGRVSAR